MWFLTIWLGTTIIFLIPRLAPGDPVAGILSRMTAQSGYVENAAQIIEAWRARFGLDQPLPVQYIRYVGNSLRFDLGYSLANFPSRVEDMVFQALPWTVGLLLVATLISFVVGNTIGALMAWERSPGWLKNLLPVTLTFTSIPFFMLGILLIYVFAFGLQWLRVRVCRSRADPGVQLALCFQHWLPCHSADDGDRDRVHGLLGTGNARHDDHDCRRRLHDLGPGQRAAPQPYFLALRGAQLDSAPSHGTGADPGWYRRRCSLVEYIFAYPGVGYLLYQGIVTSDYTLIQGIVFMLVFTTATLVLILDLIYPLIDPRITYERG